MLCVRLLSDENDGASGGGGSNGGSGTVAHLFVLINVTRQCQTVTLRAGEQARERVLTDVTPPAPGLCSAPTLKAEPGVVECLLPAYGVAWLLETDADADAELAVKDAGDSVPFCRSSKRSRVCS